jgi:hypothetical protein
MYAPCTLHKNAQMAPNFSGVGAKAFGGDGLVAALGDDAHVYALLLGWIALGFEVAPVLETMESRTSGTKLSLGGERGWHIHKRCESFMQGDHAARRDGC